MTQEEMIKEAQRAVGVAVDGIAGIKTWSAIYTRLVGKDPGNLKQSELIIAVQQKVMVTADGIPGIKTWTAVCNVLAAPDTSVIAAGDGDKVDTRSEKVIATLHQQVQPLARKLVQKAAAAGITIKVISGLRTYDEQDALYAQGRTKPGAIVTNARGGYSNHNFGLAFDIGVFENEKYLGTSAKYETLGPIGMSLGLAWGGNWKSIRDTPHYELRPEWAKDMSETKMLAGLRGRKENNTDLLS